MYNLNSTHSPELKSFIQIPEDHDFPIQNLPFGVFKTLNQNPRVGVAIGDYILDMAVLADEEMFNDIQGDFSIMFHSSSLNAFMAAGKETWSAVRARISHLLSEDTPDLKDNLELREKALIPAREAELLFPVEIGDYTDFYSSKYHAFNVGTMFRGPENALQPNYLHLPVAYHGRSSSIVVSGTDLHRPLGQTKADEADSPEFGPSKLVDYELEMGFLVGPGTKLGERLSTSQAENHIFGMVLVNDWSARDIQKWEYVPLGPFLSKNFGTSISPWVVTMEALEPFKCEGQVQDPEPLDYLKTNGKQAYDIKLEVSIQSYEMKNPQVITKSNHKYLYWSITQQLAHHAATGCALRTGDLLASGTISGPEKESRGCLLELTWRGAEPITLDDGSQRKFIKDNDRITIRGWSQGNGFRVGFGEVTGKILPSLESFN